jgi:3-oxoacyl-[acyl-carrier-protein] synthase III
MSQVRAGIPDDHSYPQGILTNADLENLVDTDEWITTRTVTAAKKAAPSEYVSQFANTLRASARACQYGSVEVDLILCATVTR